jgi:hypothetical protein
MFQPPKPSRCGLCTLSLLDSWGRPLEGEELRVKFHIKVAPLSIHFFMQILPLNVPHSVVIFRPKKQSAIAEEDSSERFLALIFSWIYSM